MQQRRAFGRANLYLTSKQKSDSQRAGAFTKLCNEIWSAAKDGGADPDGNHRLALAISKAKDANVPKANIERALARATETADAMEEVTYELYAQGGVGLIVAANTDSPNRTIRALKGVVKDHSGASMAAPGAVAWQFERTGLLRTYPSQCTLPLSVRFSVCLALCVCVCVVCIILSVPFVSASLRLRVRCA